MRILHIIAQKPSETGSGIYIQALIKEAAKKNYAQGIIAGISARDTIDDNSFYGTACTWVHFDSDTLPFSVVGMSDVMPYKSTRYSDLTDEMYLKWISAFQEKISKTIAEFKPDIIIAHHLWLLTSLVKKIAPQIPVLAISHGTDLRQLKLTPRFSTEVIAGCHQLEKVIALTDYQKEMIHNIYKIPLEKIVVLGGGYDSTIFYPPEKKASPSRIRILYAGKLSYAKGVISLLRSYNQLIPLGQEVELLLVGDGAGEEAAHIKELSGKSLLPVELLGKVDQKKLGELFRNSSIFVLPSFYEGLGLVILEALACGLRIVVSDLPGLKNWLGKEFENEDIISYVKLPPLQNVDFPTPKEEALFEQRLKIALEHQIQNSINLKENPVPISVQKSIKEKSWSSLFLKIDKILQMMKKTYGRSI